MVRRNELHQYLKCERHLADLLVAQEKLAGAVQAFVQHELNFHLQEYLANASDLLVRMPKVVRRFEVMRHTELVSQRLINP